MNALFRRQLRRLAPYALALVGLTVVVGLWLVVDDARAAGSALSTLFPVAAIVTASVLAVASIAPDTGSGGTAFFARLPIGEGRVLAIKLAAACALGLAAIAVELFGLGLLLGAPLTLISNQGRDAAQGIFPASFALATASALLASVVAARTMPALVLAPTIAGGTFTAVALASLLVLGVSGLSDPFGLTMAAFLAALLFAGACFAYTRGDRHRAGARPFALATALVVPGIALFLVGTKTAQAWTLAHIAPELSVAREPVAAAPGSRLYALSVRSYPWCGLEDRVALLDPTTGKATLLHERGVTAPEISPDGKQLLLRERWGEGGHVVDLATLAERPVAYLPPEQTRQVHVWRDARPLAVFAESNDLLTVDALASEHPRRERDKPLCDARAATGLAELFLIGTTADGRVLASARDGVWALDPALPRSVPAARRAPERVLAWPQGKPLATAASPGGARLLFADREARTLEVLDRATGERRRLETVGSLAEASHVGRAAWSRDETRVAIELASDCLVFDARTGRKLGTIPFRGSWVSEVQARPTAAVFSPDGRFVSPWSLERLDLETGAVVKTPGRIGLLLDGDRWVFADNPLGLASPAGTVTPAWETR